MDQVKRFIDGIKSITEGPLQVDLATHKPTDNELNNLSYLSLKYICNFPMRQADFIGVCV